MLSILPLCWKDRCSVITFCCGMCVYVRVCTEKIMRVLTPAEWHSTTLVSIIQLSTHGSNASHKKMCLVYKITEHAHVKST